MSPSNASILLSPPFISPFPDFQGSGLYRTMPENPEIPAENPEDPGKPQAPSHSHRPANRCSSLLSSDLNLPLSVPPLALFLFFRFSLFRPEDPEIPRNT